MNILSPLSIRYKLVQATCILMLFALCATRLPAAENGRGSSATKVYPRLFVFTDISSLQGGVREPDDAQSMIRLMLYSNQIDLEGLAASSNLKHGQLTRPELILEIIAAYEKDLPKLRAHDPAYPAASDLRALVCSGQPVAGPAIPVEKSIGDGKETDASRALIKAVDRNDPRPLWVAVWGGTADLAQALWSVRQTRSPEQQAAFIAKLRVHAIDNQDSTAAWIQKEFPTLFYIQRSIAMRGMYRNGDTSLVTQEWVNEHAKGHGALGELYPIYDGGDRWTNKLGRVRGIKEGDTPSYLNLISGDPMRGWGGTFIKTGPKRFSDEPAPADAAPGDLNPAVVGVYRHRAEFQADFARRLEWCKE